MSYSFADVHEHDGDGFTQFQVKPHSKFNHFSDQHKSLKNEAVRTVTEGGHRVTAVQHTEQYSPSGEHHYSITKIHHTGPDEKEHTTYVKSEKASGSTHWPQVDHHLVTFEHGHRRA
jgi:hypothetical protein